MTSSSWTLHSYQGIDNDKKSTFLLSYFHLEILFLSRLSRWKVTNLKIVVGKRKNKKQEFRFSLNFEFLFVCFDFAEWLGREKNWAEKTQHDRDEKSLKNVIIKRKKTNTHTEFFILLVNECFLL